MTNKAFITTMLTFSLASTAFAQETTTTEDKVVATVNGQKVYASEIERNIQAIPGYNQVPEGQQEAIRAKILDSVTKLNAVVQEAEKLNIQEDESYKSQLADFKKQLMYSTLLEKHLDSFITDEKLKEYYVKNQDKYAEDKAKASHILVKTEEQAKQIIQQLNAGASFGELAEKESIGPSSNDGGNLGWFNKEMMVPEFSEAAFALEANEYTKEPIQTQFGWHVILLEDKVENTPSLFEDVKEEISQEVMQTEVERYLESIIKKSEIVINEQ